MGRLGLAISFIYQISYPVFIKMKSLWKFLKCSGATGVGHNNRISPPDISENLSWDIANTKNVWTAKVEFLKWDECDVSKF